MLRRLALAGVLLIALVGCAPAASPSLSGPPPRITGTVTAGPVCPVDTVPPDPKCAPRLVAGAIIVATSDKGIELARATTAADGTYSLTIAQTGVVNLTGLPMDGYMGTPKPVTVALDVGAVEKVDLSYDTGIR